MKFIISQASLVGTYHGFLRQAGYSYHEDRHNGQISFARSLGNGRYPRFHIYVDEYDNGQLAFKIHLDQKAASYEGTTAHSGEYDEGPVVEEVARLKFLLKNQSETGFKKEGSSNPWASLRK